MSLRDHVSLRDVTYFKTGGIAEYFTICHSLAEMIEAIERAKQLKLPYRVIGDGTNTLMSDSGFPGIVIQNKASSMVCMSDRSQFIVDAGMSLAQFVSKTISLGYSGLEFLAKVPGTVGGAVFSNASAFGQEIGDYVKSVTLLHPSELSPKESINRVNREWFDFHHRSSKLKTLAKEDPLTSHPVILSVTFQLSRMNPATCLHRYTHFLQQRKDIPSVDTPALEVFDSLRYDYATDDGIVTHPRLMQRKTFFVTKQQVRQWKQHDVIVFPTNPNYLIHSGLATSNDTAALITTIKDALQSDGEQPPEVNIDYLGLWC